VWGRGGVAWDVVGVQQLLTLSVLCRMLPTPLGVETGVVAATDALEWDDEERLMAALRFVESVWRAADNDARMAAFGLGTTVEADLPEASRRLKTLLRRVADDGDSGSPAPPSLPGEGTGAAPLPASQPRASEGRGNPSKQFARSLAARIWA